jgi:hypothetical protein
LVREDALPWQQLIAPQSIFDFGSAGVGSNGSALLAALETSLALRVWNGRISTGFAYETKDTTV